jgi:AraC-like DNA-binding protein
MPIQRFAPSPWARPPVSAGKPGGPLETLSRMLGERFGRITGLAVTVATMDGQIPGGPRSLPPTHPACDDVADKGVCARSWEGHLSQLHGNPRTHWHRCDSHRFCAVVPFLANRRCVGMCKLVCMDSVGEDEFLRYLGVLEVVVESFQTRHADQLLRLADEQEEDVGRASLSVGASPSDFNDRHPQVRKAVEYIDEHLSEVTLTVNRIARALGINSTYLAHLFSVQTGIRATHYITARRIELAKSLLATTDWQVKRIAYESGHANADWFSQVFRNYTGTSPREYRRAIRGRAAAEVSEA